jgi:hypothetical protein
MYKGGRHQQGVINVEDVDVVGTRRINDAAATSVTWHWTGHMRVSRVTAAGPGWRETFHCTRWHSRDWDTWLSLTLEPRVDLRRHVTGGKSTEHIDGHVGKGDHRSAGENLRLYARQASRGKKRLQMVHGFDDCNK